MREISLDCAKYKIQEPLYTQMNKQVLVNLMQRGGGSNVVMN